MAAVSLGAAGRNFSNAFSRVSPHVGRIGTALRHTGGASTDGFAGTYQSSSYHYAHPDDPTDYVQLNTVEGIARDGILGARVSAFDAQLTLGKNGKFALAASGPNAQAVGGVTLSNDLKGATLGGSIGLGGVQASGALGSQQNNLRGSVGVGLGLGASVDASLRTNVDLSSTASLDLGVKALGRFNLGVSVTSSPPSARTPRRGRNPGPGQRPIDMDRARDLAQRAFDLKGSKPTTLSATPAEPISSNRTVETAPVSDTASTTASSSSATKATVAETAGTVDKPNATQAKGSQDSKGSGDSKDSKDSGDSGKDK